MEGEFIISIGCLNLYGTHVTANNSNNNNNYVFTNGLEDQGSVPGRVIPKTKKKMVLDDALHNTQDYKVHIKSNSALPYTVVAIEKGAFGSPSTKDANLLILAHNVLDKRGKNISHHYLFGDKIIHNCVKIDATH